MLVHVPAEVEKLVKEFYESDSVPCQLPGRKDFVIVRRGGKKTRLQKKVLLTIVLEAFKQFKCENQDVKLGKSKFVNMRPQHVLQILEKDHTVCCCSYHENYDMLLNGIRKGVARSTEW